MRFYHRRWRVLFVSFAFWVCATQGFAQDQSPDVVRVNTSLVQTDVMVFDKQGGFVDGLKRDQFVLKIDGKPRNISFFEPIITGSHNEEAQLAAARGNSSGATRTGTTGPVPLDRGRTVFFFIDDMHLSIGSMAQAHQLLDRFVDHEMGQNDEAAVTSSSGQIGFLQQLTDDRRVLKMAINRLIAKSYLNRDSDSPPMTEYQAMLVEGHNDDVLGFFVDEVMRQNPGMGRSTAEELVHNRASQIVQRSIFVTTNTLASLKTLVNTSATLPGRKLIFFISDGFLLDTRNSDSYERLRQITSAAAAAGVIIYAIDAKGLTTGMADASTEGTFDPSGRLQRSGAGELGATQNGLSALAADSGGRAFFNSNALSVAVTTALKETSAYYLLAWRPENDDQRNPKGRRIEVTVEGRPELTIRFPRSFGDTQSFEPANAKGKPAQPALKGPNELLGDALKATYPKHSLPMAISLNYVDVAQFGGTLTTSIKVSTDALAFGPLEGRPAAADVHVAGGIFDDQGKLVSTFGRRFTITSNAGDVKARASGSFVYNHFYAIKPGLYQVRVAAADAKQGRVGSAVQWIEIPDLASKTLALSTLIVGERKSESEAPEAFDAAEPGKTPEAFRQVNLNIDHQFAHSSHLRFQTFIYNAVNNSAGGATTPIPASSLSTGATGGGPDLAVQVQVFRDNEPVITMPLHKIQIDGQPDLRRVSYAAELALDALQRGRYMLLVTVIDRPAKTSASQKFSFQVD